MDGYERMKFEMSLDAMKELAPAMMQFHAAAAPLLFNYFKELVGAGFHPEHALKIVMAHGMIPKLPDGGSDDGK